MPWRNQADSAQIKDLEKCDFRPMHEYFEIQKDKKKQLTAAEKKRYERLWVLDSGFWIVQY